MCILAQDGTAVVRRKIPARPERLLRLLEPFRDALVGGVEGMLAWYWVVDRFIDESVRVMIAMNVDLIDVYDQIVRDKRQTHGAWTPRPSPCD